MTPGGAMADPQSCTEAAVVVAIEEPAVQPEAEKDSASAVIGVRGSDPEAEKDRACAAIGLQGIDPEAEKGAFVAIDVGGGSDPGAQKVCRICHLSADLEGEEEGVTSLIELGCGCKGELGVTHRLCAEAWFKVKGSSCCEICGATAKNITGVDDIKFMEKWHEGRELTDIYSHENSGCRWRRLLCNLLIACLAAAILVPWFLRMNMF